MVQNFRSLNLLGTLPKLILNDQEIEISETVKNLGLVLQRNLDWTPHIDIICQKMFYSLRVIRRHSFYTPLKTKLILVKSLILSHLFYCDIIFSNMNAEIKRKVFKVYNSCIRYIFNLKKYDHISQYSRSIFGCTLECYLEHRIAVFIFRVIKTRSPSYIFRRLSFSASTRTLNLNLPSFSTTVMDKSFIVRAAKIWNSLPLKIKSLDRVEQFRRESLDVFKDIL